MAHVLSCGLAVRFACGEVGGQVDMEAFAGQAGDEVESGYSIRSSRRDSRGFP